MDRVPVREAGCERGRASSECGWWKRFRLQFVRSRCTATAGAVDKLLSRKSHSPDCDGGCCSGGCSCEGWIESVAGNRFSEFACRGAESICQSFEPGAAATISGSFSPIFQYSLRLYGNPRYFLQRKHSNCQKRILALWWVSRIIFKQPCSFWKLQILEFKDIPTLFGNMGYF